MRIQSSHHHAKRGRDAYFSPSEATAALLTIEHGRLPQHLWGPAAGDGAIVRPLRVAHFDVVASDLVDYGDTDIKAGVDYLTAPLSAGITGIVTDPPHKLAVKFACKVLDEVPVFGAAAADEFSREHPPAALFSRAPAGAGLEHLAAPAYDASARLGWPALFLEHLLCVAHLGHAA
jgi:hypothetical protein